MATKIIELGTFKSDLENNIAHEIISNSSSRHISTTQSRFREKKSKTLADSMDNPKKDRFSSELFSSGHTFTLQLKSLKSFYECSGANIPVPTSLSSNELPQPYRKLLFHDRYMTPRLEQFYNRAVYLRPLWKHRQDNVLSRCVILEIDGDGDDESRYPVEFGAIQIYLENIPEIVHEDIINETKPFGACITAAGIPPSCLPKCFFSIACDAMMADLFNIPESARKDIKIYGRMNVILNPEGKVMAEVMELLPPQASIKVNVGIQIEKEQ